MAARLSRIERAVSREMRSSSNARLIASRSICSAARLTASIWAEWTAVVVLRRSPRAEAAMR